MGRVTLREVSQKRQSALNDFRQYQLDRHYPGPRTWWGALRDKALKAKIAVQAWRSRRCRPILLSAMRCYPDPFYASKNSTAGPGGPAFDGSRNGSR